MTIDTLSRGRRVGILFICSMSLFLVGLDITAVNVALPDIGAELHADVSGLQWTVSAYTVVAASLLMLAGSTGDRFGRKRTLTVGMSIFAGASLLCALATSVEMLIAFRVLQAMGASMLNPVAMAIITNTFTEPRERAQAVGVWGAMFGVSIALGPIIGGAFVSTVGWQWIFLINVPLGLLGIALITRFIPESKAPKARRFDPVGQVLVMVLLASVTFVIIEGPEAGWVSPPVVGAFSAAMLSLAGLLRYEPRRDQPLVDPRFFRSIPFSSSIALSVAAFASFGGFLFLNTLYLQDVRGLSPIEAGVAVLPLALMTVVCSPISGRILGKHGPRLPLVIAGGASMVSCAMLTGLSQDSSMVWLIVAYGVFGIGFGFVNAPITNAAISGMPKEQAGVAAAIATTSRLFGQAFGVAVTGAILASQAGSEADGLAATSHPAWWTLVGFEAVVLVLAYVATSHRAKQSAIRVLHDADPSPVNA